jgi:hypothetical protein
MPRKKREPSTRYYNWEDDACRVHDDGEGKETADIYRAGKGLLPVSPTDVTFKGIQIRREAYDRLVAEEDDRGEREKTGADRWPSTSPAT